MKRVIDSITLLTIIFIGLLIFLCHFHFIFTTPLLMIHGFQIFQAWILQHFLHISNWASVLTYSEDMLRTIAFSPLKGNRATDSFRVYLNHLVAEDMHFNSYVDHCETRPFDEILIYSGWLAYK